jgi:hypothetical protein
MATAWKTGSATDYIDLLEQLRDFAASTKVDAISIGSAGTGYSPGDVLTLVGGTFEEAATVTVDTVGGGGDVTGVTLLTPGLYEAQPSNDVVTTVAPPGGTGCEITVDSWVPALGWEINRDVVTTGSDRELMLQGDGGGTMEIYVGIRSFNDGGGSGAYNWELGGFTGFASGSDWGSQPGVSPGGWDLAVNGAYVPLRNASITYWFFVNDRRIIVVAKVGTAYVNMYLGLINQLGTNTEYPYPLAVFGCNSTWNHLFSSSTGGYGGMVDPIFNGNTSIQGPAFIRDVAGNWLSVINSFQTASARTARNAVVCFPCGRNLISDFAVEDRAAQSNGMHFDRWVPGTGIPGTPTARFIQTPTDEFIRFPTLIIQYEPTIAVFGELDNVSWASAVGDPANIISEDVVTIDGDDHLAFQNCLRTETFNYFLVKKE